MSAGGFINATYGASYANVTHPIRIQFETTLAQAGATVNTGLAGSPTNPISAVSGGSKRRLGLQARYITMKIDGVPPSGYSDTSIVRIPILDPADIPAFSIKGTSVSYLDSSWTVLSYTAEVAK